jgi:hypothetical protein
MMLIAVLVRMPPPAALIPIVLAVAVGALNYRSVPKTFTLTTDSSAQQHAVGYSADGWAHATTAKPASGARNTWLAFTIIHRVLPKKQAAYWLAGPFLIMSGVLLSRTGAVWLDEYIRFVFVPMAAYIVMAFTGPLIQRLSLLDGWPLSPSRLFALMFLPAFVALLIGYGAGNIIGAYHDRNNPGELITFCQANEDERYFTCVPYEFLSIAWNEEPPLIESPMGETQEPWYRTLHKGSPIKLYSPITAGTEASIDFTALQISRATEAIYGVAIAPEEVKERYLQENADGHAVPKGDGLTIQADYPGLKRPGDGPLFPVLISLTGVLWLVLLGVQFMAYRAGVSKATRVITLVGTMAFLLLGLWGGQLVLAMTGIMDPDVVSGFWAIVVRQLGSTLWGTVATYVVCAGMFAAAYGFALSRFKNIDVLVEQGCYR